MSISKRLNWVNIGWLFLSPLTAAISTPIFLYYEGFSVRGVIWFVVACLVPSISITAGYHRLFSHRSYEARPLLRFIYLLCGAANFQGSALQWATDHRRHHSHVDSNEDPYSINKGFWYAHMGWLFHHDTSATANHYPKDLTNDRMVMFQHNYYVPIAIVTGFLVPLIMGALVGNAWGGLIIGGFLRVVVSQHNTFLINSLSHFAGRQTYALKTSARDNILMAFLAYGEGWHSYHHRFQYDYRNGFRWYHWDPTKWLISATSFLGLAGRLKKVPSTTIIQAKMQTEEERLLLRGVPEERLTALKSRFDLAHARFKIHYEEYRAEYQAFKKRMGDQSKAKLIQLRAELRVAKLERKMAFAQWCAYVRTMRAVPVYQVK